jgi:hypothetical protein
MQRHRTILGLALAFLVVLAGAASASNEFQVPPPPKPSIGPASSLDASSVTVDRYSRKGPALPFPMLTPGLLSAAEGFNFDDNGPLAGTYTIPPDPHCAAGLDHVVDIGNVIIEWRLKNAPVPHEARMSLQNFFSALPGPPPGPGTTLGTTAYDPKVIFDQYSNRFVVVALERWDTSIGSPSNQSRILVAVSKTPDPNMGWWYHAIDSKITISGSPAWADYPGVAVDDQAIYITTNMFQYLGAGGAFLGVRLWIINKAPFYGGPDNSAVYNIYDPYAAAGISTFAVTTQPAHMYGPSPLPNGSTGQRLGTFLCSYSGLTTGGPGGIEAVNVIEVTDPLGGAGGPFFVQQFVIGGDIENIGGSYGFPALPDAPQLGTAALIEVNDRRALNAVWRDGMMWVSTTISPNQAPDIGQTTAHWWMIDATTPMPGLVIADEGNVGAEDLGAGTYTFFPSVMVDNMLNMAIGFSASNSNMFCGAYYAGRFAVDLPGTIRPAQPLAPGLDWYLRTFGGSRNRWGDFSGLSICPVDQSTFWVFNEYACERGTPTGSEDGRWCTRVGSFNLAVLVGVDDAPAPVTALEQNAPNPFNPTTTIRFTLPSAERVTITIYDVNGMLIRTLADETLGEGPHELRWDGTDNGGAPVASGVYVYRMTAGSFTQSKKMVLLK